MSPIRVIARAVARPGREAELHDLLQGMLAPTHAEDGCIVYELYRSEDSTRFYFSEQWTSKAALDRHMETPHFQALSARISDLVAEPLEVALVEPVAPAN